MWRVVYRELRAVTNDASLALNPMQLNDIYDLLWDVGTLLTSEDSLTILEEGFRPWPKIKHGTEESWDFYDIHERDKAADLAGFVHPTYPNPNQNPRTHNPHVLTPTPPLVLRSYEDRQDLESYKVVLIEVFHLFGEGIKESLTRTMGAYLEATGGRQSNANKTEWEKEITSHMICTNNPAESPFATVRAYLNIYPSMKLRTLAANCSAVCNGNPHPNPYSHLFPFPIFHLVTFTLQQGSHRPQLGETTAGVGIDGCTRVEKCHYQSMLREETFTR
jgi:hypothetical protein